ncbi:MULTISPECIES: GTP cyclohydrolase I FolE2 [Streptomyces]|uniref:GTP cyclohydrolase I FolE2 n=1 Tax=Streptomyces TaxID=1883 RepID=UPI0018755E35|nr:MULTISPECIES: GTP cyclohydrolase, FolE2/MptA family [Streptomyces]MDX2671962.1 GTP cyclohydrolase, FolE2/MptA family [Streptomyces sp. NRRL_ISP-5395]GHF57407.1 GTP cyclohydrolase FolE2 [Streptomyces griseus]
MHDIQNEPDRRGIAIDEVGISGLRYPLTFDDGYTRQQGIADISATVGLQADRRGTHMSRLIALVHEEVATLTPQEFPIALKRGLALLDAPALTLTLSLPIATAVTAPASQRESWQTHDVTVTGRITASGCTVTTSVTTHVTSLCPCSKAISDYGAHNQRSEITLEITGTDDTPYPLLVHEIIQLLRATGSAPVIPLIKRPDERVVTMQAYDHPVFVEDIIRDISLTCRDKGLTHTVTAKNLESIHSHDAIATLTYNHH